MSRPESETIFPWKNCSTGTDPVGGAGGLASLADAGCAAQATRAARTVAGTRFFIEELDDRAAENVSLEHPREFEEAAEDTQELGRLLDVGEPFRLAHHRD